MKLKGRVEIDTLNEIYNLIQKKEILIDDSLKDIASLEDILLGLPVDNLIFLEGKDGRLSCINANALLSTISEIKTLIVTGFELLVVLNGSVLDLPAQRKILNTQVQMTIISPNNEQGLLAKVLKKFKK